MSQQSPLIDPPAHPSTMIGRATPENIWADSNFVQPEIPFEPDGPVPDLPLNTPEALLLLSSLEDIADSVSDLVDLMERLATAVEQIAKRPA